MSRGMPKSAFNKIDRSIEGPVNPGSEQNYDNIRKIDGKHPWQTSVPGGHVLYRVRARKNGKIAWFNFSLAKEMGLIPANHPEELNQDLEKTLLDTFAIQIINEYDIMNGVKIDPKDVKPNFYMATRYLQLQHPGRTGITSGDGRSIWNGFFKSKGVTWDISSCGTGATCLSPATHKYNKFFRTGDPAISYGCGYSDLDDGIMGAMFSEILHKNGLETERCLLVVEFPGNLSINVRAGKNLLRPSHFFNHLKQGNLPRLRASIDYYINREVSNQRWPAVKPKENPYQYLLKHTSKTFAEMAAKFESEYIFCWLAWDGDNILCNGGIIDYGSIRQFGLFHHEYRYDDVERFSTNLTEQKAQARYLVQTFAQIENYINTGSKKPISDFRNHPELREFDRTFKVKKRQFLLERCGFTQKEALSLLAKKQKAVQKFEKSFTFFERKTRNTKKHYRVADGITKDALFSMRDILRELPIHMLQNNSAMSPAQFMKTIASSYCRPRDKKLSATMVRKINNFQTLYSKLLQAKSKLCNESKKETLNDLVARSKIINRYERITGDAICMVGEKLLKKRQELSRRDVFKIMNRFIQQQILSPDQIEKFTISDKRASLSKDAEKLINGMFKAVKTLREGI
ncbi:MAG: protein adenylyltransferase SelO family protein [Proteobacteria bacterium]|nr:protein adenylyltransferase SelO family protein [Pseudomonadota bacterium]